MVQATAAYLNTWSVDELVRLPENCRPDWVWCGDDIEFWADRLTECGHGALMYVEDERHLDRMTSLFLAASVRMRQMELADEGPDPILNWVGWTRAPTLGMPDAA